MTSISKSLELAAEFAEHAEKIWPLRTLRAPRQTSLVRHIWNQRQLTGPLDRRLQFALVHGTRSRNAPRQDLPALRHKRAQQLHVLVVDIVDFVRAEFADLPPAEHGTALSLLLLFIFFVAP